MFSKIISTVVVLELLLLLLDMKSHSSGLAAEGTSRTREKVTFVLPWRWLCSRCWRSWAAACQYKPPHHLRGLVTKLIRMSPLQPRLLVSPAPPAGGRAEPGWVHLQPHTGVTVQQSHIIANINHVSDILWYGCPACSGGGCCSGVLCAFVLN